MNYINITNSSANRTSLAVDPDENDSTNSLLYKILIAGLPPILITLAIIFIFYLRRRKRIDNEQMAKNDSSINYLERKTFDKYESSCSKTTLFKSDLESGNKMFSFPETIHITKKFRATNIINNNTNSIEYNAKRVCRIRKSKPILFKLHEKSMKNINSFNDLKKIDKISEIGESPTKTNNNDDDISHFVQIKLKFKYSSCKNFNFSPQKLFMHKSLGNNYNKSQFDSKIV